MRPDEKTGQTIQNREHAWNKTVKKVGSNALKLGSTLAGVGIAPRLLPFLSEFIAPEIALKGITKISPKLGEFLNKGMNQGMALSEGLQYLKSQLSGEGQYAGDNEEQQDQLSPTEQPQQAQPESLQSMSQRGELLTPPPGRGFSGVQQQQGQPQQQKQKSQIDDQILAAFEKVLRM